MDEDKDSDNIVSIRNTSGQFVKGSVGNPHGRMGKMREEAFCEKLSVEQLYRKHAVEVFEALLKLIRSKDCPPTPKINAIKEFNTRALGSASTTTIIKSDEGEEDIDLSGMDDATLRAVAERASRSRKN